MLYLKKPLYLLAQLIILGLGFWGCNNADTALTEEGVSLALADYRAKSITNIVYDLKLTIPKQIDANIIGMQTIYADINDLSKPLILDFKAPTDFLTSVTVNEVNVKILFEDEHIIINKKHLVLGSNIIDINFTVGETSLNRNKDFLYTLFVPDRARTAFPCFDQPNLKAKFKLTLTIPKEWRALANGAQADEKINDDYRTIIYAETKPLSTYLFDFVAGEGIVWGDVFCRYPTAETGRYEGQSRTGAERLALGCKIC